MRRWPSTASTEKTSPQPNAKACTQRVLFEQATKGVVLGDEIALLRVLIKRFADQIQSSQGVALSESAMHLAVVSEAMLRLASLLRTDHMLGGTQSSTLLDQLNRAFQEVLDEKELIES